MFKVDFPTYTFTASGPQHALLFTATVQVTIPATGSAPVQVLCVAGTPQHKKVSAEQAAAAAALQAPQMVEALRAMGARRFLPAAAAGAGAA